MSSLLATDRMTTYFLNIVLGWSLGLVDHLRVTPYPFTGKKEARKGVTENKKKLL